jgi:hypothetical protein
MKITLTETKILNGVKTITTEKLQKDDIRLELLKSRNSSNSWGILGYYYSDRCSHTKQGYRVTQVQLYHKQTKETIIQDYEFN